AQRPSRRRRPCLSPRASRHRDHGHDPHLGCARPSLGAQRRGHRRPRLAAPRQAVDDDLPCPVRSHGNQPRTRLRRQLRKGELRIDYPLNPHGRGFYVAEDEAEGQPLPNFEELDQRITTWNDAPDPAGLGFCPYELGVRARSAVQLREGRPPTFDLVGLLNSAFPRMVAPPIAFGQSIQLEHFTPKGRLTFAVPDPGILVRMQIGEKMAERPLKVEQIGIAPDLRRAFITYRYPFRYRLRPTEE